MDDWINGEFEKEGCGFSSSSCETWSGHWSSVQDPGPAALCNVSISWDCVPNLEFTFTQGIFPCLDV